MNTPPGELAFDSSTEKFLPLCLSALQMDRVTASLQYTNPCNTPLFHCPTVGIKLDMRCSCRSYTSCTISRNGYI